jgi:hypothetical protein
MGSTCASFHVLWRGNPDVAAKAISRAYAKLGYERAKRAPAEAGKHVTILVRDSEPYVSIYDSTNADLDSGELKDAALAASKLLKTGAVFTSLYDSDSYEFVVFNNGKQVDMLMTDVATYNGPLQQLTDRSRVTQWGRIFARRQTADGIRNAVNTQTPFANDTLAALCGLIGLPGDRPQAHYSDFTDEPGHAALHFTKQTPVLPVQESGQIALRNYYDVDNSRKLLVWPASWPMPTGREELLTWLMLSEGAGFTGGRAFVDVAGPDGLTISKGVMNGAKFHHGQIVGGYELPKDASPEAARAYLESKRFVLTPIGPATSRSRSFRAEYPNLSVPPMTPDRTTQILVILQLYVMAPQAGEWTVRVTLHPQSETGYVHELPGARVAAVEPGWMPVVSGLNPRTAYHTEASAEEPFSDAVIDLLVQNSGDPRLTAMPFAEARSLLESWHAQMRERHRNNWLRDLQIRQKTLPDRRGFDHPAVASNVAILPDEGQATLDTCRAWLEDWLRRVVGKGGEIRLHAERQMTEKLHVGKLKKTWPAASVLHDKAWARLFDRDNDYQGIVIGFVPEGGEFPVAGMGLHCSLRPTSWNAGNPGQRRDEYRQLLMALTLGKLRGHRSDGVKLGATVHVSNWVIAHDACYEYLETSAADMKRKLDTLAAECFPLQAWHGQSTWIPRFDLADGYQATDYEDMSVLNFFRGILFEPQHSLTDQRMTLQWCSNVLRMVTPHMWLCDSLIAQVDRTNLERVATVSESNGRYKIEQRPGCAMDDFELALLPILPIESARITVL